MKTLYFSIAGGLAAVAAGIAIWKYRKPIKETITNAVPKAKGMAKSTWGRVANAADELKHTERPPQGV